MKELIVGRRGGATLTDRSGTVDLYFNEVSRLKMLTVEEEVETATEFLETKSREARDKLINANLRFVISVAKQYQRNGLSLEDLIMFGNIGLIKAVERFDPTRGFKFISFAVNWIRQSITEGIANTNRTVYMPQNRVMVLSKIRKETDSFIKKHERYPSDRELAELVNIPEEKLKEFKDSYALSLDKQIGNDQEDTFLSLIPQQSIEPTDYNLNLDSRNKYIQNLLNAVLTDREIFILNHALGIGVVALSQEEIGSRLDLTRERVRQIQNKAIQKLKNQRHKFKSIL